MAEQADVEVRLDNRIRLMSAILAATSWPDKAQQRQPHGTHAHARATRKYLSEFTTHPAVQNLQNLLDQAAPLEAMYTFAMCLSWPGLELTLDKLPGWVPPMWVVQLRDFYQKSKLGDWWQKEDVAWQKSLEESRKMFKGVAFRPFLKQFLGDINDELVFVPNILYPSDQEIGIRFGRELVCVAPPRLAWGDSPPWPFDEDPTHVYRAALTQFGGVLLRGYLLANASKITDVMKAPLPVGDQFSAIHPTWETQFTALFVAAAVAIYLEDHVSKSEAKAYVLMARKAQGLSILPGTVSVLRRYLDERNLGRYTTLIDFMPVFPKQLRVAKRIMTL